MQDYLNSMRIVVAKETRAASYNPSLWESRCVLRFFPIYLSILLSSFLCSPEMMLKKLVEKNPVDIGRKIEYFLSTGNMNTSRSLGLGQVSLSLSLSLFHIHSPRRHFPLTLRFLVGCWF